MILVAHTELQSSLLPTETMTQAICNNAALVMKNESTYACILHVEYFELITRCMQIEEASFYNKYYVNHVDIFCTICK